MTESQQRRRRFWVLCALGRNSLIRRHDRLEALVTVCLLALFVAAIPTAMLVGRAMSAAEAEQNQDYMDSLNRVEATVVAVRNGAPSRVPHLTRNLDVKFSWGFDERTETVSGVGADHRPGDRITVWLDSAGQIADPPRTPAEIGSAGLGVGLALWTSMTLASLGAMAALRAEMDRRRYAAWDRQWRVFSSGNGRANRDP
ncbi:hypothetical protein [Mycobacterium sp. ACS4331]|uniref:Rv1733c family protein n=1 Tax=Mycobacterium sp. ACS4331 TaxID=1834121 RepID=UPI0007FD948C|nr:hypothetical protein [Mycobacterium sp. ACS4331]OBF29706.1 hypothetical protein A5727_23890 [Mycobacterium sp. ACS4331]